MRRDKSVRKTALITGGSRGLGRELVRLLSAGGFRVFVLSRSNPESLPDFIPCDVGDEGAVSAAIGAARRAVSADDASFGGKSLNGEPRDEPFIDLFINNAGVGVYGAVEYLSAENIRSGVDVNFTGAVYCLKHALPHIRDGGKIINISSAAGLFALPFKEMYCGGKAALNMLSYGLYMDLSDTRIQVCAVCPGDIDSGFNANRLREGRTNPRYGDRIANAAAKLDAEGHKRMSASRAARKIYKLIGRRRLPPMRIIGFKMKTLYFISRFLPLKTMLRLTDKHLGG